MKKNEFEKRILQEKIGAHRKVVELEVRQVRRELNPGRAAQSALKKVAPKIATAAPVIATLLKRTPMSLPKLGLIAGAAALIPILIGIFSGKSEGANAQKEASSE